MDITVDATVRRALGSLGLTHHFYMDFLLNALRGLRGLNIDVLHNLSTAEETIVDHKVSIPTDSIGIIGVYEMIGDKIKPLYRNKKLNPAANVDEYPEVPYRDLEDVSPFIWMFKGREFIKGLHWNDYYIEIEEEGVIRFDQRYQGKKVLIVYVSPSKTMNNMTILPDIAEDALFEFMIWQWSRFHASNRFDYRWNRKEFYNEKRKLRSRKFKLNINDYIRRVRSQHS